MNRSSWEGVMPAITTPFTDDLEVDHAFLEKHVAWLCGHGMRGIVTPGSLGEGSVLSLGEKCRIWETCQRGIGGRVPLIAAIAAACTKDAAELAREASRHGCTGLMILPPYIYKGSWREIRGHFDEVLRATELSCMLYNNPLAYGTDILPEQVLELAERHANLHAVKESSADVRRITSLRALGGERLAIFVGVDDLIVEGIAAGATGWIAGVVNAMPAESVRLFSLALGGSHQQARELYEWILPLLRMDTTYDFVQLIKLIQLECGVVGEGGARVRMPRLMPEGEALAAAQRVIRTALSTRPSM